LPIDKTIIAFGAINATDDPNKGFTHLYSAMQDIKANDAELVVFGSNKPIDAPDFKQPVHYLGHLHDEVSLRVLYSAADVMIVPSLQENLSNAIMESLACGTPVVAFNIGGNSDMIDHRINGYLAAPFNPTDLANGIEWVLNAPNYQQLCNNARNKVLTKFDSKVVVQQYMTLYKEILAQ
jgi:glycosyltransferase involved in cell wall biosynthesis